MSGKKEYIEYFEKLWTRNKAMGLAAQIHLEDEMQTGSFKKHSGKLFQGCWLLSPNSRDSYKFRFCFFVHNKLLKTIPDELDPRTLLADRSRPFYAIAEYMNNAGVGVVYAIPTADDGLINFRSIYDRDYSSIKWNLFLYENEKLVRKSESELLGYWAGRGRPSYNKKKWDDSKVKEAFGKMKIEQLEAMMLNELFYTGYLKSILKKSTNDPYDVDGFVISLSQKHILPIELKEKFPVANKKENYFGIDAGRVLMLLRICVPNDSNALYIVRQVAEDGRKLEAWKFTTLAKIIMSGSWNILGGGIGMGGGDTHTIKIPYVEFEDITEETFDEENLKKISNLPKDVKEIAMNFRKQIQLKYPGF